MVQNLQKMQSQPGQNSQGSRSRSQKSMEDLAGTLRQQQTLSDKTFRDLQDREPGSPRQNHQKNDQSNNESSNQSELETKNNKSLAEQQRNLQNELKRQRGNLPATGTAPGLASRDALDEASREMDLAIQNLERGNLPQAIENQSKVIDALRDGMQKLKQSEMSEQMQAQGATPGDQRTGDGSQNNFSLDPLGRDLSASGQLGSGENMLRKVEERLRSQALMDEIRKRSDALERPTEEREYLKRLLDKFQD